MMKRPWRPAKDFDETLRTLPLSVPHGGADRLVSFSGTYRALLADARSTVQFSLQSGPDELAVPVKRGPVTLTGFRHVNQIATLSAEIDKDAFPTGDYDWVFDGTDFELLDAGGNPARQVGAEGSGGKWYTGKGHPWTGKFSARGRVPATFVVRYPVGCSVKDIRFEFKDVGLPRRPGRYSYEEEVF